MKLSTRLTILLIALTTLVASLVGFFAVATSSRSQYESLDTSISAVVASGGRHPLSALSNALNFVQANNLDLTLDVVDPTGTVTQIATSEVPLTHSPTLAAVRSSLTAIRSSNELGGFRYRSIPIAGGSYLLIAGSTAKIAARIHQLVVRTIEMGLLAALVMGVVARYFMRRDLRTIEELVRFAQRVAMGDVAQPVPAPAGSTDVRELHTALAHMVLTLQHTIETEKRSSKTMQRFIGDASHELRTPLTVIKGYAELLAKSGSDNPLQQRALERVQKEVNRMDALVGDLLFLAEVSEVRSHEAALIDLSELTNSNVLDFSIDHPHREVTSLVEPGLSVEGHADYAERLIVNALGNIARHTAANDPVRVALHRESHRVILTIEDGGPGMPEESYGARPEQFQRFDPSRSRSSGGSGLGMSIMADIATSMGGVLTTSKSSLGGLALIFTLPDAAPPT